MSFSSPLSEALHTALTKAEAERLALKIYPTKNRINVCFSPKTAKTFGKQTLLEALKESEQGLDPKPLPPETYWEANQLATLLEEVLEEETNFHFEADFRKAGKGKVFYAQIGFGMMSGGKVEGLNAVAVLGEALMKTKASASGNKTSKLMLGNPKLPSVPKPTLVFNTEGSPSSLGATGSLVIIDSLSSTLKP